MTREEQISDLLGLGKKSEEALVKAGIETPDQLRKLGAVQAYFRLVESGAAKPNLNFLYALAGALEERHWKTITREEKLELLSELEGLKELDQHFR